MIKSKKKKLFFTVSVSIFMIAIALLALPAKTVQFSPLTVDTTKQAIPTTTQAFNKQRHPIDQASSLWVVVNKGRILPSTYAPSDLEVPNVSLRNGAGSSDMQLRTSAARALEAMFKAAKAENISLQLESGYRSYNQQSSVYSNYVASYGQQKADTFSARAGHSEHQTGLAADIEPISRQCEVEVCFADTKEGQWLAANCYKYGFIIRYQEDTQSITGYQFEPWHVRYVGTDLARQIQKTNQTLEQFFELNFYKSYPKKQYEIKNL